MNPKRLWTEQDGEEAVMALHKARTDIARLCRRAPLRSQEMAALNSVMSVTADALRVFGHDVNISLARSARENLRDQG